jgi:hypothetical protein
MTGTSTGRKPSRPYRRNAVPDSGGAADDGSAGVPSGRMRLEPNVTCMWASLEHRRGDDYVDDGTEGDK